MYTCQLFLRYKREIFILGVLGFLKTTRSFPKIPEEVRSLPKKSEVFQRRPKSSEDVRSLPKAKLSRKRLSTKSEIVKKVLSFIHFTHGFRSLHGSELKYFWKLCQARRQQLTFFNQAWEIGPQAWVGVRSKFSTRRRESWQVYVCKHRWMVFLFVVEIKPCFTIPMKTFGTCYQICWWNIRIIYLPTFSEM